VTEPRPEWAGRRQPGAGRDQLLASLISVIEQDPGLVARIHAAADTDGSPLALHHTLGGGALQAAAGNHQHTEQAPDLLQLVRYEEEFLAVRTAGNTYAWLVAETSGAGTGHNTIAAEAGRPGIVQLSTGSTAAGTAGLRTNSAAIRPGNGTMRTDWLVFLPVLSTAAEEYVLRLGFLDDASSSIVDGAWLVYDRTATVNWRARTAIGAAATFVNTAAPVVAGAWLHLAIEIAADSSRADYYLNGAAIASITTNVPIGAGAETGCGLTLTKTVGTTARVVNVDYARLEVRSATVVR
jgi:hypothetical protein